MVYEGLTLEAYEIVYESVTGFKVYRDLRQVGTIEKRNNEWIAAVLVGFKVITFTDESFDFCLSKLNKLAS